MGSTSQPSSSSTVTTTSKRSGGSQFKSNAIPSSNERISPTNGVPAVSISTKPFTIISSSKQPNKGHLSTENDSSQSTFSETDSNLSSGEIKEITQNSTSRRSFPSPSHPSTEKGRDTVSRNTVGDASPASFSDTKPLTPSLSHDQSNQEDANKRSEGKNAKEEKQNFHNQPSLPSTNLPPACAHSLPSTCATHPPLFANCAGKCSHKGCFDWRGTIEYRAAWDVEVWKALQVDRFRQQLEKHKAAALEELQRRVRKQEKAEEELLQQKRREMEQREKGIKSEEQRQIQQRRRLDDAEKELATSRQQTLDAQKRAEEEIRIHVRRANEDYEHKALRLRDQVSAAEGHSRRLEERLARSEADYLHLFEEFHRFRTEHVVHGTSMMHNGSTHYSVASDSGKGNATHDEHLGEAKTSASLMVEMMRSRHAEELRALDERLEAKYKNELEKVRQECATLIEKNGQLTAALARRREQLRHLRNQQHLLQLGGGVEQADLHVPTGKPSRFSERGISLPDASEKKGLVSLSHSAELERLQRERHRLIYESGGALGDGDPVVDEISRRIIFMQTQLSIVGEGGQ